MTAPRAPMSASATVTNDIRDGSPYHLIGIGGVGMAAVAELLRAQGAEVQGSDKADSETVHRLNGLGIRTFIGHDAAHVDGARTVVVTSAVREENPELVRARQRGLPVLHRSQALALCARRHDLVAVAGTHGKTTTSAMAATIFAESGADPTFAIGGVVLGRGTGAHVGAGRVMVIEADESDGSFLNYSPTVAVVTNVEADHLDHYGTVAAYRQAFMDFASRIIPGGTLVFSFDDEGARAVGSFATTSLPGIHRVSYGCLAGGESAADVSIELLSPEADFPTVVRLHGSSAWAQAEGVVLRLRQPGTHNASDAAAAWIAAVVCGVDPERAALGVSAFRGTGRRFELRGEAGGVRVIDDYAHHPTEIRAALGAARLACPNGRIHVIFQPHLFSRTKNFAGDFASALSLADDVVVLDVYASREDPVPGVTGRLITDNMEPGTAVFIPDRDDAVAHVVAAARPSDIILTIGAGDVTELGSRVLAVLGRPAHGTVRG